MKKAWSGFQMVILVVFAALATYLLHQLLRYTDWGWFGFIATISWIAFVFALGLSQPLYFWGNEKVSDSVWTEWLNTFGYLGIHYVSDIMTMILLRDVIGFAAWGGFRAGFWAWDGYSLYSSRWTILSLMVPFFLLALGYLTVWLGPFVRKVKIRDARIPISFRGFKIAHLSDIHLGQMMSRRLVQHLLEVLKKQKFDAIILTGDIVDCDPIRYKESLWLLGQLKAPQGVYYCPGNHEYYWGFEKIEKVFEGTDIQVLQNETRFISHEGQQISLTGLPDPVSKYFPHVKGMSWEEAEATRGHADYRILLAHQPHLADEAVHKGYHLQFSGHTHGGQFFPWNLLIYFFQKYNKGLYRVKKEKIKKSAQDLWLYVNQGTGFWGPPTRLGTYGEITLVELRGPRGPLRFGNPRRKKKKSFSEQK